MVDDLTVTWGTDRYVRYEWYEWYEGYEGYVRERFFEKSIS